MLKKISISFFVLLMTACGGGGGDSSSSGEEAPATPATPATPVASTAPTVNADGTCAVVNDTITLLRDGVGCTVTEDIVNTYLNGIPINVGDEFTCTQSNVTGGPLTAGTELNLNALTVDCEGERVVTPPTSSGELVLPPGLTAIGVAVLPENQGAECLAVNNVLVIPANGLGCSVTQEIIDAYPTSQLNVVDEQIFCFARRVVIPSFNDPTAPNQITTGGLIIACEGANIIIRS